MQADFCQALTPARRQLAASRFYTPLVKISFPPGHAQNPDLGFQWVIRPVIRNRPFGH
jgi:hypothetical protein